MGSGKSLTVLDLLIINSDKDRTGKGGGAQLPLGYIYNTHTLKHGSSMEGEYPLPLENCIPL